VCLRYVISYHGTWLVNSVAHMYGNRPYETAIFARENAPVSLITLGEGWHNYHHAFPWDYKASELGFYTFNMTTAFIDFFAMIGWAYDLKTVPMSMIAKRVKRTGDGSHPHHHHSHEGDVWGWDDKDMKQEDKDDALVTHKRDAAATAAKDK
ncbi:acyl-CoA desaturase, partial [bacterium LRH843]|nr:acyl-CoA desaturase [bacterium LRH843]